MTFDDRPADGGDEGKRNETMNQIVITPSDTPRVQGRWHGEAIIADTLQRGPEVQVASSDGRWRFCRWRQFVGSYGLPPLPEPMFVVQLAGRTNVRTWLRDSWSEETSFPGAATIVPAHMETRWLVDGELDVVTLSIEAEALGASVAKQFRAMRFAFSDPFGAALCKQIVSQLYAPATRERDDYLAILIDTLKAHVLRGPAQAAGDIPVAAFSAHRVHQAMNAIQDRPEAEHSIDELAARAKITPSHFCRVFKRATGMSPHQYVLKTRMERAQQLLRNSDASMLAISERLGFTSQAHFTRAFHKLVGETPTTFRKRGEPLRPAYGPPKRIAQDRDGQA